MEKSVETSSSSVAWLLRRVVGIALVVAAFVHFAAAPPHLDEQFSHGLFFVAVGWVQFLLGVFLLARPRGRAYLVATAAINLAIVVVWIVSRTAGLDGPAESIGFGDTFAVVLEVLIAAGAFALGLPAVRRAEIPTRTAHMFAGGAITVCALLFAFALSTGLATGHDHAHVHVDAAGDGHDHGDGEDAHDHGHNPAMGQPGHDHAQMLHDQAAGHSHTEGEAHEGHDSNSGDGHAHDSSDPTHAASHSDGDSSHSHGSSGGTASAASHSHGSTDTGHSHGTNGGTTDTTHNHGNGGTTDTTHNHGGSGGSTPTTHDHGGSGGTTPTTHDHGGTDWETTRRAALIGGVDTETYNSRMAAIGVYLSDQIRSRGASYLRQFTRAEREARIKTYVDWTLTHALDAEHGVGNHAHGPEVWQPMDAGTTGTLNTQLAQAKSILPDYPTAADAMNAGFMQVTPWTPGIGAHYLNVGNLFAFDPRNPAFLLYNGNSPTSVLVGVSYALLSGPTEPAGFAGPNDHWHEHPALCLIDGAFVIGADNTPQELCESVGGAKSNGFFGQHLWMMHLWQVPGWSSSWGLFSGESPAINLARTDIR